MNLLLVDDEPLLLENMKFILSHLVKNIFVAKNGKEALDILRQEKIHCVVTDLTMPVMNGLELIREARRENQLSHFIVYSAYLNDEVIASFREFGVEKFLRKPEFVTIEETVAEVLNRNLNGVAS